MSFPASKSSMKFVRKPRSNKALKGFRPQLTSLVDVMTILLVYLLQSFSAEGNIITVSKELVLPQSSAQKTPALAVTLTINTKHIIAEGTPVASVDQVLASDELVIEPLFNWLSQRRAMTEKIGQYSTTTKFTGDITIVGDRRIRFRLLKKIMYTCGQQGFNNFSLIVQKKAE